MPLAAVSIGLPTYNAAARLEQTIKCLLAQTYRDFKLIVIDDGSSDSTESIVRSFQDARIRFMRNPKNLGMAANWNRSREEALRESSPYIGIFHQDDYYAPMLLEREVKFLEKNRSVGLVYPAFHYHNELENRYSLRRPYNENRIMTAAEALDEVCFKGKYDIATPAVLARKEAYIKAGEFDESFKMCPDLDLWWRMLEFFDLGYIQEPLFIHTVHKAQVSSSAWGLDEAAAQGELKRALESALARLPHLPDLEVTRYRERIAHYCAGRAIVAAKDAFLSGDFAAARKLCAGANGLSRAADIRRRVMGLRLLNNPLGRSVCLAAVKTLRHIRAKTQMRPSRPE